MKDVAVGCLILLAAGVAAMGANDTAEPTAPTLPMPDKVFDNWKAAIESYDFGRRGPEDWDQNLAALQGLRKLPWPDFDKVKWVRLTGTNDSKRAGVSWVLSQTDEELVLLLPDLNARRVDRKMVASVEPVDPKEHLDKLLEYLKHRDPEKRRPWDFTFIDDFGASGLPYYGGTYLLHYAYAAAWLGREAVATALVYEAL